MEASPAARALGHQQKDEGTAAATASWVQLLESQDLEKQAAAVAKLGMLLHSTESSDDLPVITEAVPILLAIMSNGSPSLQVRIAGLLTAIVIRIKTTAALVEEVLVALVSLLHSDSKQVQCAAAHGLSELAYNSKDNKRTVISAGAIPLLEAMCSGDNAGVQHAAADALCIVAISSSQLEALVTACALPTLVRLLRMDCKYAEGDVTTVTDMTVMIMKNWMRDVSNMAPGSMPAAVSMQQEVQIWALHTLSRMMTETCQWSGTMLTLQIEAGVPNAVVSLLQDDSSPVQLMAAWLLSDMLKHGSDTSDIAADIAAAGAIPALIPLLQSKRQAVTETAADTLSRLLTSDVSREAFVGAGGFHVLAALLHEPAKQQHAISLLSEITDDCSTMAWGVPSSIKDAAEEVLPPLVQLLHNKDVRITAKAAASITRLTWGHTNNQTAAAAAGALPLLVALLRNKKTDVQGAAVLLLRSLLADHTSNKAAFVEAGGISAVLSVLRSPQHKLQQEAVYLMKVLTSRCSIAQSTATVVGAIPCLLPLLTVQSAETRTQAAVALVQLAFPTTTEGDPAAGMASPLQDSTIDVGPTHSTTQHIVAQVVPVFVSILKHSNPVLQHAAAVNLHRMLVKSRTVVSQLFIAEGGLQAADSMARSLNPDLKRIAAFLLDNFKPKNT